MGKHFSILCPPTPGHLNPMIALAKQLQTRGHIVSFIGLPDGAAWCERAGLQYFVVGANEFPVGSQSRFFKTALQMTPVSAVGYSVTFARSRNELLLRDVPAVIRHHGIEGLIVDQLEVAGGTIAEHCKIPYVTVCNALPVNTEVSLPPYFTDWNFDESSWSRTVNGFVYSATERLLSPVYRSVNERRKQWNLRRYRKTENTDSLLAIISQMVKELDFPRVCLPECFQYVGPLRDASESSAPFPYDALDGRPIVFASLGTIVNFRTSLFRFMAEACLDLDLQVVIAHGGALNQKVVEELPGRPLTVVYAPQRELIARSSLVLTHAGLNTVLDALSYGVPMVACPISGEQPGIAARVRYAGVGETLPNPDRSSLRHAIEKVIGDISYKENALKMAQIISRSGGASYAAQVVETAMSVGPLI
jgi:MGT family glycosyltransferase